MIHHELRAGSEPTLALATRLASFAPLSHEDLAVLSACAEGQRTSAIGAEVWAGKAAEPRVMISGWAGWVRMLPDGRRQILQLLMPGDVLGLSNLDMGPVVALTRVVTSDARPLQAALRGSSDRSVLRLAWVRSEAVAGMQRVDHMVRLGRLSAYERAGHLMLETLERARRAGLCDGRSCPWPLTQEVLADILGLSVVHVNRILQQLRREGAVELRSGRLMIRDPERLAEACFWRRESVA